MSDGATSEKVQEGEEEGEEEAGPNSCDGARTVMIESLEILQCALHTVWQCALFQIVEL